MAIKANVANAPGAAAPVAATLSATPGLAHELQAGPIAVQKQGRGSRRAPVATTTAHDRYRDLDDHAPVGYLTLDSRGRILEANQTAAQLLGHPLHSLTHRPLSAFLAPPDAAPWPLRLQDAFRHGTPWRSELSFRRPDGRVLQGQLDGLLVTRSNAPPSLRVTLIDVALQHQADAERRVARRVVADQEADRHRLARELHDDLGQRLSALKMNLAARAPAGLADAELAAMVDTLDEAVASVRRMTSDLRPLMLDDLGLAAAVEALARRSARQYGFKLRLILAATDPSPGAMAAVTLYRVLQASLPLLAGQPGLGSLRVELHDEPGVLVLSLRGLRRPATGGEPPAPAPGRWTALREMAHLLGCTLAVSTERRGGERVEVRMPLQAAELARHDA
jgi:PAS domain S-box-containing protein